MPAFLLVLLSLSTQNIFADPTPMANTMPFVGITTDQPVCYGREYSPAHLKAKPKQTVKKIQAKLEIIPEYNQNVLNLEVTLRGEKNQYTNYRSIFSCFLDDGGKYRCGIDCDGGSVKISMSSKNELVISVENGFILSGGCGSEEKDVFLQAVLGGDDKFVMTKLPAQFCAKSDWIDKIDNN